MRTLAPLPSDFQTIADSIVVEPLPGPHSLPPRGSTAEPASTGNKQASDQEMPWCNSFQIHQSNVFQRTPDSYIYRRHVFGDFVLGGIIFSHVLEVIDPDAKDRNSRDFRPFQVFSSSHFVPDREWDVE